MIDYTVLKTLITTDPDGVGFAPYLNVSDVQVAAMFNDPAGPGAGQIDMTSIAKGSLLKAVITATDQLASGATNASASIPPTTTAKWTSRFNALRSGDDVIVLDTSMMGLLGQLVTDGLMTQGQIDGFTNRLGTYGEVNFGQDTVITQHDIAKAMGRG